MTDDERPEEGQVCPKCGEFAIHVEFVGGDDGMFYGHEKVTKNKVTYWLGCMVPMEERK